MSGLAGYQLWPSVASVELAQPSGDIVLTPVPARANISASVGGLTFNKRNGVVTIPAIVLADAISRRLTIEVRSAGKIYGGYIKFLPEAESEDFTFSRSIAVDGRFIGSEVYKSTDYIDVEFVDDITAQLYCAVNDRKALYAYDADKQPVKALIGMNIKEILHIVPDGTYKYIVGANYMAGLPEPILSLHRSQD